MKKLTTEEFIEKAKKIHGDKYDYSKSIYNGYHRLLTITCPKHGDFQQLPSNHIAGMGCKLCCYHHQSNTKEFIEKAKLIHGDKYDYSKVNYIKAKIGVNITCPIHGDFLQTPNDHLDGCGCPSCSFDNKRKVFGNFLQQAQTIHGNKYSYDLVNYKNNRTKICITCPEHGEFLQTPINHISGCGCPKCKNSHLEIEVRNCLFSNLIKFEQQKTWQWLTYRSNQYVDFYLPDYNIVIECQGLQHFQEIEFFGGVELYMDTKLRDKNKLDLCTKNGIKVLYYSNLGEDFEYPYEVFTDLQNLIDEIKKISPTN